MEHTSDTQWLYDLIHALDEIAQAATVADDIPNIMEWVESIRAEEREPLEEALLPFAARYHRIIREGERPLKVLVPFQWLEEAAAAITKARGENDGPSANEPQ